MSLHYHRMPKEQQRFFQSCSVAEKFGNHDHDGRNELGLPGGGWQCRHFRSFERRTISNCERQDDAPFVVVVVHVFVARSAGLGHHQDVCRPSTKVNKYTVNSKTDWFLVILVSLYPTKAVG
jgi:hypothetical protein